MGTGTFGGQRKIIENMHEEDLNYYRKPHPQGSIQSIRDESRGSTYISHLTDKQLSRAETKETGAYDYLQRGEST
jgi:hypothetical protein